MSVTLEIMFLWSVANRWLLCYFSLRLFAVFWCSVDNYVLYLMLKVENSACTHCNFTLYLISIIGLEVSMHISSLSLCSLILFSQAYWPEILVFTHQIQNECFLTSVLFMVVNGGKLAVEAGHALDLETSNQGLCLKTKGKTETLPVCLKIKTMTLNLDLETKVKTSGPDSTPRARPLEIGLECSWDLILWSLDHKCYVISHMQWFSRCIFFRGRG